MLNFSQLRDGAIMQKISLQAGLDFYNALKECLGAHPSDEDSFIYHIVTEGSTKEYRLNVANLPGCKFRNNGNGIYLDYYHEHSNSERDAELAAANDKIVKICREHGLNYLH